MTFSPKPYFGDNSSDDTLHFRAEAEDHFQGKTKDILTRNSSICIATPKRESQYPFRPSWAPSEHRKNPMYNEPEVKMGYF